MKFNKWTLGLAAIGVVTLASAARADEKMSSLQTALSNTTISGYISASFNWAITPGADGYMNSPARGIPYQGQSEGGMTKQDGFNLDVVKLSIAKPQDESPWASGYQVDLLFGPDAVGYNPSANGNSMTDYAIKQAYVALRTPVGNGIDWKVGVFDTIIGYEVFDAGSNPNYTRSLGNAIEPTEHTGILATYKVNDMISLSAGIANTLMAGINRRAWNNDYYQGYQNRDWNKTFMGSVTITAPSSWGWAAGSSFYAGIVYGFNGQAGDNNGFYANGNQVNYYAGATLNTPWKQLTVGAAFDYAHNFDGGSEYADPGTSTWKHEHIDVLVAGLYATYKATDKLSFNARGEYVYSNYNSQGIDYRVHYSDCHEGDGFELTGTVEYDLWANVISRLEVRWDHINQDWIGGGTDGYYELDNRDSVGFYANIIYKF